MPNKKLRIVSRESPLAMWQARHVRERLLQLHPGFTVDIIGVKTVADRFLDRSLASMGGKGVFVKELEQAILAGEADMAVHSMKDVTVDLPEQLLLPVILPREDAGDVLVSNDYESLDSLPQGARVATSSLRRQCQIRAWRTDLELLDVRGNVNTRLEKLDRGDFDALVLAAAGLKRLGLAARIRETINTDIVLPAVGQGALGIEIRADDETTHSLVAPLDDMNTHRCVETERQVSRVLYGGCHLPIAVWARTDRDDLCVSAMVGKPDGSEIIRHQVRGGQATAGQLASDLAAELLARGADRILQQLLTADG